MFSSHNLFRVALQKQCDTLTNARKVDLKIFPDQFLQVEEKTLISYLRIVQRITLILIAIRAKAATARIKLFIPELNTGTSLSADYWPKFISLGQIF